MSYRIRLLETGEGRAVSCLDLPGRHSLPGIGQKQAVRVFQKLGHRIVREPGHLIMSNGRSRLAIPLRHPIKAITMGATARDPG